MAYKHYQPGNHKICIINTAQNVPQKVIDLGEWEFVHFVNHTQMTEKRLYGSDVEQNCNITFIAERDNQLRLMSYRTDPWMSEDEINEDDLSYKHSVFLFSGAIAGQDILT